MSPSTVSTGWPTNTAPSSASPFSTKASSDALRYGFKAEVKALDAARENLPRGDPVAFITASYEGQPPDNATHFFEWLKGLEGDKLEGVNYAVFGCGHHDWQATFHSIPKAIDRLVRQRAGPRLCEIGTTDAANSDMFTDFDSWGESVFWPAVMSKLPTALSVPEKRMLRFKLPPDMTYQCGDYLAILPINPPNVVRQAIRRFNLSWDSMLTVWKPTDASGTIAVPLETPISALELFSTYGELSQPASKRNLKYLADAANGDTAIQNELRSLASDATRFAEEIFQKRVSPLDILLRHPVIDLPLNMFLAMLSPMRVRQYSISSSPLVDPSECSITFSVLKSPSPSTSSRESGFEGVASTYLAGLQPAKRPI
ncbi:fatty acid hydroxylase [Aspergillus terreus]|uniref:Fatty acid hydroxylase n=1 Tax=Aspergillus terreus TaxID=33178 RepID=A0A5M3YNE2_ASPTE|nr:hypothetical protein ATETN484_0001068700 [Aspergillus terreus]GFF12543.1 fatty acid hydroxylase [Aspergillus terreus]